MNDAELIGVALFALLASLAMLALFVGSVVLLVVVARLVRRVPRSARRSQPPPAERSLPVGPVHASSGTSALHVAGSTERGWQDRGDRLAVASWCYRQLLELDVEPVTAAGATLAGVDAAAVRSLVGKGCPALLALSIVEPDD